MGTWIGAVVETGGRDDFGEVLRRHGIEVLAAGAPAAFALVEGRISLSALEPPAFAEALSRELGGTVLAFFAQTTADVYELRCFRAGACERRLAYSAERGGWVRREGAAQPWERGFFFGETPRADGVPVPDMLSDDASDEDRARYEEAKRRGDPTPVLDLLRPSASRSFQRLCEGFGVDPRAPTGRWRPPRAVKPWLVAGAIGLFLVGMALLGALDRR